MSILFRALLLVQAISIFLCVTGCSDSESPAPAAPSPIKSQDVEAFFTPATGLTKVTATPVGGGVAYTAVMTFPGTYRFQALPLGSYSLRFEPAVGYVAPPSQVLVVQASSVPTIREVSVLTERIALMTAVRWKVTTNQTLNTNSGITVDNLATAPACAKDNIMQFMVNGDYTIDQGPLKCSASDPQVLSRTWALEQNETYVRFRYPEGGSSYLKMVRVTATQVHMLEEYTEQNQRIEHTLIYTAIP